MCRSVEKIAKAERDDLQVKNLKSLMDTLKVSVDNAMDLLKVPEAEREMYRKLLAQ